MNFVIKITDFGLSEDVFERSYFRQGGNEEAVKLPVKWMAPESLSDGHFSEKSDVVGFQNFRDTCPVKDMYKCQCVCRRN